LVHVTYGRLAAGLTGELAFKGLELALLVLGLDIDGTRGGECRRARTRSRLSGRRAIVSGNGVVDGHEGISGEGKGSEQILEPPGLLPGLSVSIHVHVRATDEGDPTAT
jgi:hypothetical protein